MTSGPEPAKLVRRPPGAVVGAAAVVAAGVVAASLVLLWAGLGPSRIGGQPVRPPVPDVMGQTAEEAEARLAAAGYVLEITPGETLGPTEAVLRQSPLAGWGDFRHGIVRVTFVWSDDFGQPRTLPASTASVAASIALGRVAAEGLGAGVVVEIRPLADSGDGKGYRCAPERCAVVHVNSGQGGAAVAVEPGRAQPVLGFAWYATTPWPPDSVFTDEELVAAALADPQVAAAVQGKQYGANVLSGGTFGNPRGLPCELPNAVSTCVVVIIEVPDASPGLVSVNYVTLAVRLDRSPGE